MKYDPHKMGKILKKRRKANSEKKKDRQKERKKKIFEGKPSHDAPFFLIWQTKCILTFVRDV